jgi:hypothetical protein
VFLYLLQQLDSSIRPRLLPTNRSDSGAWAIAFIPDFSVGDRFPNCYFFEADGTWVDPAFPRPENPVPGTWIQHSVGAKTDYTAFAEVGILLWQEGTVTPAQGRGVLQLEAHTAVFFGDFALAEFVSVGSEVDECPL